MRASLPALTTWLALVACLLSGIAPGRQIVVCVEADGSIAVEVANGPCEGCGSDEGATESERSSELASCPCVDIVLSSGLEQVQAKSKAAALLSLRGAVVPAPAPAGAIDERRGSLSPLQGMEPRPGPSLGSIRTVVLRV